MEIINATDGYKLGHHRMYPEGTQMVYSNWTPRSNRYFPEATEGSVCPIRVPMMTIKNTLPDFFWLTNYLETLISCTLWLPCTSATSARLYKKRLMEHARKTGFPEEVNLGFSCHDFSMRGMAGLDAAIISGMAHMTSFCGSETIPAIEVVEHYYNANVTEELVAATVPASEHSVMCAGGEDGEIENIPPSY